MISIQAKIILGCVAFALVASALTIWLVLAWGNGMIAMLTPLALGGALALVTYTVVLKSKSGPS
ncbi:hypothetical protein [Gymnodinialimonas sp.]